MITFSLPRPPPPTPLSLSLPSPPLPLTQPPPYPPIHTLLPIFSPHPLGRKKRLHTDTHSSYTVTLPHKTQAVCHSSETSLLMQPSLQSVQAVAGIHCRPRGQSAHPRKHQRKHVKRYVTTNRKKVPCTANTLDSGITHPIPSHTRYLFLSVPSRPGPGYQILFNPGVRTQQVAWQLPDVRSSQPGLRAHT